MCCVCYGSGNNCWALSLLRFIEFSVIFISAKVDLLTTPKSYIWIWNVIIPWLVIEKRSLHRDNKRTRGIERSIIKELHCITHSLATYVVVISGFVQIRWGHKGPREQWGIFLNAAKCTPFCAIQFERRIIDAVFPILTMLLPRGWDLRTTQRKTNEQNVLASPHAISVTILVAPQEETRLEFSNYFSWICNEETGTRHTPAHSMCDLHVSPTFSTCEISYSRIIVDNDY